MKNAVRTWTEAEVLQMAGLQPVQKSVSWGRVIRYGGAVVAAGSLIYAALDWFYDQAQQATGTSLDEWRDYPATGELAARIWITCRQQRNVDGSIRWTYGVAVDVYGPGGLVVTKSVGGPGCSAAPLPNQGESPHAFLERVGGPLYLEALAECAGRCYVGGGWIPEGGPSFWADNPRLLSYVSQPELAPWLAAHPDAMSAVRSQVLPQYVEHLGEQPGFPWTYREPFGAGSGVEVLPPPNRNQWYDNPFADPSIDTDGDGFTDAEEAVAGTDPNDPEEFPTVSPWPEPEPGEEPWPDVDGDGVPDQFDPCPFDAQNRCVDAGSETSDGELPDDYAREPTQQRVAAAVEGILDVLREDTGATPSFTPLAAPEPADTSALAAWLPDLSEAEAAWSSYMAQVEADFADLLARTQTAFPFGMGAVLGNVPTFSGSECVEFEFSLMNDVSAPVNLCAVPALDQFLATTGRNVLAAVLLLAFIWTAVHTVLRS